jgi:hypothetical protein
MLNIHIRRVRTWAFTIAAVVPITFSYVSAAEIKLQQTYRDGRDSTFAITLDGPIIAGDSVKVQQILDREKFTNGHFAGDRAVVQLNSDGGSFQEGLKLARLFRERNVETVVRAGARCFSACAIAFMGGSITGEEENVLSSRSVEANGKLGFHAPYLEVSDGDYRKELVEAAYTVAIISVAELMETADKIGIQNRLLPRILRKRPNEMDTLVNVDDFGVYGVRFHQIKIPRYITNSMLINACINGSRWSSDNKTYNLTVILPNQKSNMLSAVTQQVRIRYFSPTVEPVLRTFIPLFDGAEGSTGWCVIDHIIDQKTSRPRWSCRGILFSIDNFDKVVAEANAILLRNGRMDNQCSQLAALDPMLGYMGSLANDPLELLPYDSAISQADATFARYTQRESPVSAVRSPMAPSRRSSPGSGRP